MNNVINATATDISLNDFSTVSTSISISTTGKGTATTTSSPLYTYTNTGIHGGYITFEDKYELKKKPVYYKHTQISEGDLQETMDKTINKMIYEEICNKYDKFTWNDINNSYITNIKVNYITLTIVVDYNNQLFKILNKEEIIIESWFIGLQDLINNIRNILQPISKNDVLQELRKL